MLGQNKNLQQDGLLHFPSLNLIGKYVWEVDFQQVPPSLFGLCFYSLGWNFAAILGGRNSHLLLFVYILLQVGLSGAIKDMSLKMLPLILRKTGAVPSLESGSGYMVIFLGYYLCLLSFICIHSLATRVKS